MNIEAGDDELMLAIIEARESGGSTIWAPVAMVKQNGNTDKEVHPLIVECAGHAVTCMSFHEGLLLIAEREIKRMTPCVDAHAKLSALVSHSEAIVWTTRDECAAESVKRATACLGDWILVAYGGGGWQIEYDDDVVKAGHTDGTMRGAKSAAIAARRELMTQWSADGNRKKVKL